MKKAKKQENIWNVPNSLTLLRVLVTFATIYFIFAGADITFVAALFVFGMITDFLDGFIARRYNQTTEFGRKFDMVADRFLLVGVAIAATINFALSEVLQRGHLLQIFMIMSREVIAAPMALIGLVSGKKIPKVRKIGKLTTFLQAVAFPSIILGVYYPDFSFSIYLAIVTCVVGIFSGTAYINDVLREK